MNKLKYLPIFFCAGLAAFFTYFPITDTDIFWHLAAGREMILHRHFLQTDPFSFTLASPKWIDLHWIFQLAVYGLYSIGRLKALIVFKALMVACVSCILCLIRRDKPYILISAFCTALLFFEARYLILMRPVLITMLCMSLYIFLFEQVRQGGKKTWLWLCLPLQMVWTNSQGLYPIGIFIIGAFALEAIIDNNNLIPLPPFSHREKGAGNRILNTHTFIFILCCLSCLINPYGVSGLLLPFTLLGRINPATQNIYSLNISENVPLFSLTGFETVYRTLVIVTAMLVILLFILNRKRIRPAHVILFLGFSYLAYSAVRNVLLYTLIVIFIIAYYASMVDFKQLGAALSLNTIRLLKTAGLVLALLAIMGPVLSHASVVAKYPPRRSLSPFRFPENITAYLERNPVSGEMFNDIRYGGYLIWHLYPQKKVFIDGRLVIRPTQFFAEYLSVCDNPDLFPFVVRKFNITHAILPSAIFDRYRKLIKWLYASAQWRLEYTDGTSFLFVRSDVSKKQALDLADKKTVNDICEGIRVEWRDAAYVRSEALGYFADMLEYLGLQEAAESVRRETR